jgi:hypothetical protein
MADRVKELLRAAARQGAVVSRGSKHLRVTVGNQTITVAVSARSDAVYNEVRRDLVALGLELPDGRPPDKQAPKPPPPPRPGKVQRKRWPRELRRSLDRSKGQFINERGHVQHCKACAVPPRSEIHVCRLAHPV